MSFTSALSQASFHNNWTIAWQKKVLHLLTCVIYFHTFPGTSCAVKVYQTLFSLYAKSAWQKKKCQVPRFPHIPHPCSLNQGKGQTAVFCVEHYFEPNSISPYHAAAGLSGRGNSGRCLMVFQSYVTNEIWLLFHFLVSMRFCPF